MTLNPRKPLPAIFDRLRIPVEGHLGQVSGLVGLQLHLNVNGRHGKHKDYSATVEHRKRSLSFRYRNIGLLYPKSTMFGLNPGLAPLF